MGKNNEETSLWARIIRHPDAGQKIMRNQMLGKNNENTRCWAMIMRKLGIELSGQIKNPCIFLTILGVHFTIK